MSNYDVFISHASEDKESIAKPLALALAEYGVKVWYDEFALTLGDSLSRSIDRGLAESNFGLVILSPAFFAKDWPEYELRGLTAKEIGRNKVILPIWHNINRDDVLNFSPPLADKLALSSDRYSPDKLALQVIQIVRPDIFTKVHKRLAWIEDRKKATRQSMKPSEMKTGPAIHKELPPQLITRIRLIRAALLGAYTHSMDFWVEGFKRDAHPSPEISWWEHLAACYLEYSAMTKLTPEQYESVYKVVFGLCTGEDKAQLAEHLANLPADAFEKINNLVEYNYPAYDFEESFPAATMDVTKEWLEFREQLDVEDFSAGPWFDKSDT
jgi:hypothetical protein